jgi:hypothetical protein
MGVGVVVVLAALCGGAAAQGQVLPRGSSAIVCDETYAACPAWAGVVGDVRRMFVAGTSPAARGVLVAGLLVRPATDGTGIATVSLLGDPGTPLLRVYPSGAIFVGQSTDAVVRLDGLEAGDVMVGMAPTGTREEGIWTVTGSTKLRAPDGGPLSVIERVVLSADTQYGGYRVATGTSSHVFLDQGTQITSSNVTAEDVASAAKRKLLYWPAAAPGLVSAAGVNVVEVVPIASYTGAANQYVFYHADGALAAWCGVAPRPAITEHRATGNHCHARADFDFLAELAGWGADVRSFELGPVPQTEGGTANATVFTSDDCTGLGIAHHRWGQVGHCYEVATGYVDFRVYPY